MSSGLGAIPEESGVRFVLWAPAAERVELVIESGGEAPRSPPLPLQPIGGGLFITTLEGARAGLRYRYRVDGGAPLPDPASRFQPEGVHGPSEVIDPASFAWSDTAWRGRPLEELILYELHVGAFTPAGTFRAATDRLPDLVELGVTAIELMPVHEFPGERNWGYDVAGLFAPARCYGRPEDLRELVDAAHALGLAVHLDVVYNHLGPDGAHVAAVAPMLNRSQRTSWGAAINLDGPGSAGVRELLIENAIHWVREYHLDGFRLDATAALVDGGPRHFVGELAARVRAAVPERPVVVIAEDFRNQPEVVTPESAGGWGCDGMWSFDFHHQLHRVLTAETSRYYVDYTDSIADLACVLERGWLMTGQWSRFWKIHRGREPQGVSPARLVFYLQNHDEVGNRPGGERLHHLVDLAACRAAAVLLALAPQTPLLFMGEEWAASTPFHFFTDHPEPLGARVAEHRIRDLGPAPGGRNASNQDEATFRASQLDWSERRREPHAATLRLYRRLLGLRRTEPALAAGSPARVSVIRAGGMEGIEMMRGAGAGALIAIVCLRGAGEVEQPRATRVLDTEDREFAHDPRPITVDAISGAIRFDRPGAVLLGGDRSRAGVPAVAHPHVPC